METGKGEVTDVDSPAVGPGAGQETFKTDLMRASQGDPGAAGRILSELGSEDRRAQALAALAMIKDGSASLWGHILEYVSLGTWAGKQLALTGSVSDRALKPRLVALLLTRQDGRSSDDREAVLVRGLASPDPKVRRSAVDILGQRENSQHLERLLPLLSDPDVGVRLRAARALGRIGDPRAVPALVEALGQSDDLIAGEAADALALVGEPALEPLIQALGQIDPHVRWHAAKALSQMANLRAADALISALNDEDFGVRWFAANGLAAMGSRAVVPLLRTLRVKQINPWVAEGAIHVLRNIREPDVIILVQELEKRLGDSYANVEVPLEADRVLRKLEGA